MTRTAWIVAVCLGAALAADLPAQNPVRDLPANAQRTPVIVKPGGQPSSPRGSFGDYNADTSRRLFAACDLNGDDRVSWREARKTLTGMDRNKFMECDRNKDGRIQFNEFNDYFKTRERYGERIVVTALAMKRLPTKSRRADVDPVLRSWFANLDKDASDSLDHKEWQLFGSIFGKPEATFLRLDKDLSGKLTINELATMLPHITMLEKIRENRAASRRPLEAPYRAADLNADSLLDRRELARALGRIHPSLVRYAALILASADENLDSHIDPFEINAAKPGNKRARRPRSKVDPSKLEFGRRNQR